MARRRSTSDFESFVTVLTRPPWWACLAIALVVWLTLSPIATNSVDVSGATLDQMGGVAEQTRFSSGHDCATAHSTARSAMRGANIAKAFWVALITQLPFNNKELRGKRCLLAHKNTLGYK